MILAQFVATDEIEVTYSAEVDANDFNPGDFETLPGSEPGDSLGQGAPTIISITWPININDQTSLAYDGAAPGVLTPQEITIT